MKTIFFVASKRLVDIISALVLMIVFLPIWIVVPIAIMLDSKGPVIFKHRRMGKDGIEFEMYKFRSMVEGAHDLLHVYNPELLKQFKESDWKLANDPRITRVGKFIRTTSIDEFPQLINVLRGEMSLVGPRAYMMEEINEQVKKYPQVKRFIGIIRSVKPGLTGPWQVAGRNDIPFDKRARLDAKYAKRKSMLYDLQIMIKTPRAMLSKW